MVTKAGKNVTEMVIQRITAGPRPNIKTSNGVSATSGMVCVTSAIGMKARTMPGRICDVSASAKASARPAIMPISVIGMVCASAASSLPCAIGALGSTNR